MKTYGFAVGGNFVDIKANSEPDALKVLIDEFWFLINESESINLLGELKEDK